jgi:hypothetical protein
MQMRAEHSAQLDSLVRKAMIFFETDRATAWRCLSDASTLLTTKAGETGHTLPSIPGDLIRGGLPRWLAKRALAYIEQESLLARVQDLHGIATDGVCLDETRRPSQTHDYIYRTDAHRDRTSLRICRSVTLEPMF